MKNKVMTWPLSLAAFCCALTLSLPAVAAEAEGGGPTPADVLFVANNAWMLLATFLVFIMHLGFSALEIGLTRSKNTVNILFKNLLIVAIGLLTYAALGFGLMYPGEEFAGAFIGFAGLGLEPPANGMTADYASGGYTYWTDFLFQGMFAATAATIVSGAVAERIKLSSFLVFSTIFVATIYPIVGMWKWGGGWLEAQGFHDFAGSTLVHSVGGWGALAGVIVLGPRLGRYVDGGIRPIPGHSMPMATVGAFLLWFGWYGFNGGSVLSASPADISLVCVTTSLAAAAGVVTAAATSSVLQKQPDLSMALNGALAGLVGITAGADVVTPLEAIVIGCIAGVVVVCSVIGLDKARLDDPVGAVSVHLVCGIWGTLAVGIFGEGKDFIAQLVGVLATAALCFPAAYGLMRVLRATMGLRVSVQEERQGLDHGEHGMESYAGFQIINP